MVVAHKPDLTTPGLDATIQEVVPLTSKGRQKYEAKYTAEMKYER